MEFELTGVETLARVLDEVRAASHHDRVQIDDLFSQSFMNRYTAYDSITDFFANSPWDPKCESDIAAIATESLDQYVSHQTSFQSWQSMVQRAVLELFDGTR